jgi:TolA-binding protein
MVNSSLVIMAITVIAMVVAIWAILTRFKLKDTTEKYRVALENLNSTKNRETDLTRDNDKFQRQVGDLEKQLITMQDQNATLATEKRELEMQIRYAQPQQRQWQQPQPGYIQQEQAPEWPQERPTRVPPRAPVRPKAARREETGRDDVRMPQELPPEPDEERMPRVSLREQPEPQVVSRRELPEVNMPGQTSSDLEQAFDLKAKKLHCKSCSNTYFRKGGTVQVKDGIISQKYDCGICGDSVTLQMPAE